MYVVFRVEVLLVDTLRLMHTHTGRLCNFDFLRSQEWNDVTQIVGKKPSSFVVVRKESEGWKGYPTAGLKFSFNDSDARRMQTLWRWSINESKTKSSIKAEYSFTLDELPNMTDNDEQHMKDKDTTVMVTGIYPCPEQPSGVNFCGLLRIWDGTGDESDPYVVFTQSRLFLADQSVVVSLLTRHSFHVPFQPT